MRSFLFVLFLFLLGSGSAQAEDVLYLKDGSLLRGIITQEEDSTITIEGDDYWKVIKRTDIERITRNDSWTSTHRGGTAPAPVAAAAPAAAPQVIEVKNTSAGEAVFMTLGVLFLLGFIGAMLAGNGGT